MEKKKLIIILALLIGIPLILFLIILIVPGDSVFDPGATVESLQESLANSLKSRVILSEIETDSECVNVQARRFTIAAGNECEYEIPEAPCMVDLPILGCIRQTVRLLPLEVISGTNINVLFEPADDDRMEAELNIPQDGEEIDIFEGGGDLSITCPSNGDNCVLNVE